MPLKVSHSPAKFGCHRNCGDGDIMNLVFYLILQEHVTKWSSISISKAPQCQSPPYKFEWNRGCKSGEMMVWVCHVISKGHVTKGFKISMGIRASQGKPPSNKFSGHRHCGSGDKMF